ncbi:MAG: hypothetical protein ACO39C_01155, partial [Chthoniobacterales bacterium]
MPDTDKKRSAWRLALALGVSALATLAALIAVRGPDWIGPSTADLVGAWRLTQFAPWTPDAPLAALAEVPYAVAGPRGWQNAHIIVAWGG